MEWKWFPRRISLQIAVVVLIATATLHGVMTLVDLITESARPGNDQLGRAVVVEQLARAEASLDPDRLAKAAELVLPPAVRPARQEVSFAPTPAAWIGMAVFSALTSALLILWARRQVIRPLRAFSKAAEAFSQEAEPAELPEVGPREVQVAARAFNRMQDRIERLLKERTEMLASVGHDLRTPITRLRLRAEFMDEQMRVPVARDLDLMGRMVDGALAHLRDGRWSPSPATAVGLADFVERICEDFAESGAPVDFSATDRPVVLGRTEDIERALNSLIDNAIKYGSKAHVRLISRDNMAVVEIEDEGPGIPEGNEDHLMEPFTRGDGAENVGQRGFGLGLSAAKAIAADHGGQLRLANSPRCGLLAQFSLPIGGEETARGRATGMSARRTASPPLA
jgi:signal transduction histidine kinase